MSKLLFLSLLGLASLQAVAAAPTAEPQPQPIALPEFDAGPGWPSLADLNLTTAELYAMPGPDEASRREARALFARDKGEQGRCGPVEAAYTDVEDIKACYNFLNRAWAADTRVGASLAPNPCITCGPKKHGLVALSGKRYPNGEYPLSYPRDVALGLLWVLDHCTRDGKTVAGRQASNGNGDLIVEAMSVDYYSSLERIPTKTGYN